MADRATVLLKDWLNENPGKTFNQFLEEEAEAPGEFSKHCCFSNEAAVTLSSFHSSLIFKNSNCRREQQIKSSVDTIPQQIELSRTVEEAFNLWKEKPGALTLTLQESFVLAIVDDASLCLGAHHVDGRRELLELYDTVLCLLTFFRGGPGRRFNVDLIVAQLQQKGISATPELVEDSLTEKWTSGRRLKTFCEELLGDIGTVLVLPGRVAALVKDIGPVYKSSFKLFEDCVQSLKKAGIGCVASEKNTKQVVKNFSTNLLEWIGDASCPAEREAGNKTGSTTKSGAKRTKNASDRVTKNGSRSAAKNAAASTLPISGFGILSFESNSAGGRKRRVNEARTTSSDRFQSDRGGQVHGTQRAYQLSAHPIALAQPHSFERQNGDETFLNQNINAKATLPPPALDVIRQDDPEAVNFVQSFSPGPLNLMRFDYSQTGSLGFVDSLLHSQLFPMGFGEPAYIPN